LQSTVEIVKNVCVFISHMKQLPEEACGWDSNAL